MSKKMIGGILVFLGFMMSPLCWWNDLIFNLPIAYGFGYVFSKLSQDLFFPSSILGYWLSNLVGILLMQYGAMNVVESSTPEQLVAAKKRQMRPKTFLLREKLYSCFVP